MLHGSGAVSLQPGLYVQGHGDGVGGQLGDGLRCVGHVAFWLEFVTADANGDSQTAVDIAAMGGVQPGDRVRYQLAYRDPTGGPCGGLFNSTNGLEVLFSP